MDGSVHEFVGSYVHTCMHTYIHATIHLSNSYVLRLCTHTRHSLHGEQFVCLSVYPFV